MPQLLWYPISESIFIAAELVCDSLFMTGPVGMPVYSRAYTACLHKRLACLHSSVFAWNYIIFSATLPADTGEEMNGTLTKTRQFATTSRSPWPASPSESASESVTW